MGKKMLHLSDVPDGLELRSVEEQLEWFGARAGKIALRWRDAKRYYCESGNHRGFCCPSCIEDRELGYRDLDECCCEVQADAALTRGNQAKGRKMPVSHVQKYDDVSGDAVCVPYTDGGWWFWCEHDAPVGDPLHHHAFVGNPGQRLECRDCGTVWIMWEHGGKVLAKAVVVAIG